MKTTYQMTWADYEGRECVLTLTDETSDVGAAEDVVELVPGDSPFTTSEDGDTNPLMPIRVQTGVVTFVTSDPWLIVPKSDNQWRVMLRVDGYIRFRGWLKAETYDQGLWEMTNEIQMNVIDDLEALKSWNMDKTAGFGMVTLRELMVECLNHVASSTDQMVFSNEMSRGNRENQLSLLDLQVSRYNFFSKSDEDDDDSDDEGEKKISCKSCYEVMESICKTMGWCLREMDGRWMFTYPGATSNCTSILYGALMLNDYSKDGSVTMDTKSIDELEVCGKHKFCVEPGYHIVRVIANLNKVDSGLIPNIEYSDGQVAKATSSEPVYGSTTYKWLCRTLKDIPDVTFNYDKTKTVPEQIFINMDGVGGSPNAVPVSEDYWDGPQEDPGTHSADDEDEKKNYQFTNRIYCNVVNSTAYPQIDSASAYAFKIKGSVSALITGGAIEIKISRHLWQYTTDPVHPVLGPAKTGDGKLVAMSGLATGKVFFDMMLRVGNKWWNGSQWTTTKSYFRVDSANGDTDHMAFDIPSNKTLEMPFNATGYVAQTLKSDKLSGEVEFTLLDVSTAGQYRGVVCFIESVELGYKPNINVLSLESNQEKQTHTYSKTNSGWVTDKDAVELSMHSWNNDPAMYSVLLHSEADGGNVVETVWDVKNGVQKRPENILLDKYQAWLSRTRKVLKLNLKNSQKAYTQNYISMDDDTWVPIARTEMDWRTGFATYVMLDLANS